MKTLSSLLMIAWFVTAPAFAQDQTVPSTQDQFDNSDRAALRDPEKSSKYNAASADRAVQIGADFIMPYRVDNSSGRSAALFGAHAELFLVPALAVSLEGIFGVEDRGFTDNPIYIAPGLSFYGAPVVYSNHLSEQIFRSC
jgi:hypothetical protein